MVGSIFVDSYIYNRYRVFYMLEEREKKESTLLITRVSILHRRYGCNFLPFFLAV